MGLFEDDPAGEIAGLLSTDFVSEQSDGDQVGITLRVSVDRLAVIDAMAKMGGVSRNRMANMLLAAGCRDVIARLPNEVVGELADHTEGRF
jgi:hypothetical protein